jgi:carbohydrate-selective porin OprB
LVAQAVATPRSRSHNNYYFGLGANFSGVFLSRNVSRNVSAGGSRRNHSDAAGIAIAHAGLHRTAHRHETAIEIYYRYQFSPNFSLQPDIQWIINPSGLTPSVADPSTGATRLPNALVCLLRLNLDF